MQLKWHNLLTAFSSDESAHTTHSTIALRYFACITLFAVATMQRSICIAYSSKCMCCIAITYALQFKAGKATEMQALLKRVQTGREEQKKQRQTDLERLLQRYQNVKMELEAQQNLERTRADRTGRLPRHRASSVR
jgi:hypothetical protein